MPKTTGFRDDRVCRRPLGVRPKRVCDGCHDHMIDLDISQLPSEMMALFLQRGTNLPPLHWPSYANRIARDSLEGLSDAKLFHGKELIDASMGGAVRALLYLWNGWPEECVTHAQAGPEKEYLLLGAISARQRGDVEQAKSLLQQLDEHPAYAELAKYAVKEIGDNPDPVVMRFKQMIEMGGTWEPFLFTDLYQQARAEKVSEATEQVVRQIQCMEFELLFRHCYEAATGHKLPRCSDRSADAEREASVARVRRLKEKHRPKRRSPDRTVGEKAKPDEGRGTPAPPDTISVVCPKCRTTMKLKASSRGKNERCGKCGAVFMVPAIKASAGAAGRIAVRCPKCRSTLMAPESARGNTEKCSKCGALFLVPKKPAEGVASAAGRQ